MGTIAWILAMTNTLILALVFVYQLLVRQHCNYKLLFITLNTGLLLHMVFFAGVVLSLSGMEMSAFHAREAKNPQRDYPRAILLSAILIMLISILGSLCIAFVVEPKDVSLFAGLMQAFKEFFGAFDMLWLASYKRTS